MLLYLKIPPCVSEREGLSNATEVDILHNHYLDVLAYQVQRSHRTNSGRVLIELFKTLPLLDVIQEKQLTVINQFTPEAPPGKSLIYCTPLLSAESRLCGRGHKI